MPRGDSRESKYISHKLLELENGQPGEESLAKYVQSTRRR
jgi:hypothetical protein